MDAIQFVRRAFLPPKVRYARLVRPPTLEEAAKYGLMWDSPGLIAQRWLKLGGKRLTVSRSDSAYDRMEVMVKATDSKERMFYSAPIFCLERMPAPKRMRRS